MAVKQVQSQKVIVNILADRKMKKKKKKRKSGRGKAPAGTGSYYRPPAQAPALAPVIHSPQVDLDKYRMANLLTDVSGHIKVLQQRMDNPTASLGNNPLGSASAVRRAVAVPEASAPAPEAPASAPSPVTPSGKPKKKFLIFSDPVRRPPTISEHAVEPKPELQTPDRPRRRNKTNANPEGTEEGYASNMEARKQLPRPTRRAKTTGLGGGTYSGMSAIVPPASKGGIVASSSSGRTDGILSDTPSARSDVPSL